MKEKFEKKSLVLRQSKALLQIEKLIEIAQQSSTFSI